MLCASCIRALPAIKHDSELPAMADGKAQHSEEIYETETHWARKPLLRSAYRNFHQQIRARLSSVPGHTLELGSGIGMIKQTIPECLTSDIFKNPFVDRIENAYGLNFEDGSVANLILFDVWHHLEYPGIALQEFARVLAPGGRVILFEPAALSLLGRFVFGLFHHEPVHSGKPISWQLSTERDHGDLPYYAAQGNAWKMFHRGELPDAIRSQWNVTEVTHFPAFDWLAAGGFRGWQLCPSFLSAPLRLASKIGACCPVLFSTRMLIILERAE